MILLKQSTAATLRLGPAVAVGDGFTPVTTLTLSGADEAELLKHSGATVDISGATIAAITGADGWYDVSLTTSHTDTLGMLTVAVNDDSLILPVFARAMVVPAAVYDSLVGGTDTLPVDVTQWNGVALPAQDTGNPGCIRRGTTSTHSASTITLAAEAAPGLNFFAGCTVRIVLGTGLGAARTCASSTNANPPVLTLSRNWPVTPSGSITYEVYDGELGPTVDEIGDDIETRTLSANVTQIEGVAVSTTTAQLGVNVEKINNVAITGDGSATPFGV